VGGGAYNDTGESNIYTYTYMYMYIHMHMHIYGSRRIARIVCEVSDPSVAPTEERGGWHKPTWGNLMYTTIHVYTCI